MGSAFTKSPEADSTAVFIGLALLQLLPPHVDTPRTKDYVLYNAALLSHNDFVVFAEAGADAMRISLLYVLMFSRLANTQSFAASVC